MNYAEWLDTLAETARSHELSYDASAVRRLDPADRARAEAHLLDLVGAGDVLAFETVGKLGLAAAVPHLEKHRADANAWGRGAAARALFELRGDPPRCGPTRRRSPADAQPGRGCPAHTQSSMLCVSRCPTGLAPDVEYHLQRQK
jgi:hypothetical protein